MMKDMSRIYEQHANIANIGLGVQSTAMALMFGKGDLPPPTAMIFADTGWEREGTYENLERLLPIIAETNIPFHVVRAGNIREEGINPKVARTELPFYINASRYETIEGLRKLRISDIKNKFYKDRGLWTKLSEGKGEEVTGLLFDDKPDLDKMIDAAMIQFDRDVADGIITAGYKEMKTSMLGRQCTHKYKVFAIQREKEFLEKLREDGSCVLCYDEKTDLQYDLEEYGLIDSKPTLLVGHAADEYTLTDKGKQFLSEVKNGSDSKV